MRGIQTDIWEGILGRVAPTNGEGVVGGGFMEVAQLVPPVGISL